MLLDTQIKFLKGVGEKRAEQLRALGVTNINALFHFYPRAYEDWSSPIPIAGAEWQDQCCIKATVAGAVKKHKAKSGIMVFEVDVFDSTASLHILIFNNKFAAAKLVPGKELLFFGQVTINNGKRQMLTPSIAEPGTKQRIRPIYRRSGAITSNYIEKCVETAINQFGAGIEDPIPYDVRAEYNLMSLKEAVQEIHFPSSMERMYDARRRFIFEELFELQLGLKIRKCSNKVSTSIVLGTDYTGEFVSMLPFKPTGAQARCISEAAGDFGSGFAMNRLLQGDVGSGKTMVAAALMYSMARNGYQSAMMAPTEILARQHYETLVSFFGDTGVKVIALTGSNTAAEKREIYDEIKSGRADVIVGTHALITESLEFHSLGLAITDEQHRFGVRQRAALQEKSAGVHVLVMSATPIPRTLAWSIYGDLDISIIDELPKGRIPIETYKIDSSIRPRAWNYIKKHLDEGRQGYIVCPLVDEGELDGVLSAKEYYDLIVSDAFKDYRVGLLHGQMKPAEKSSVMEKFQSGEIQLLVSTVVIEVGVDVPNAVIMLIENAERFGLSQLHQLRGRVGRGSHKSTCILLSDNLSEQTTARLSVMTSTTDGFLIAQRDLELRGTGDFYGTRQHGFQPVYVNDMIGNPAILEKAAAAADRLLDSDYSLDAYPLLKSEVDALFSRIETAS